VVRGLDQNQFRVDQRRGAVFAAGEFDDHGGSPFLFFTRFETL
jgi:hypothetical protein